MIILGVNGFKNEHDPSVALLIDGKLVGFAEEERFNRIKRAFGYYPHNAVRWLLQKNKLSIDDVDVFAFGWKVMEMIRQGFNYEIQDVMDNDNRVVELVTGQVPKKKVKIEYVPHHIAHAASSYYASGYEDAVSIVIDGRGENESITCYKIINNEMIEIRKWNMAFSLGFLYEAASFYSGFSDWEAGKTMGLSSYAHEPMPLGDFMEWKDDNIVLFGQYSDYESTDLCEKWLDLLYKKFGKMESASKRWDSIRNQFYKNDCQDDLERISIGAGAVQETVVDIIGNIIKYCIRQTGLKKICLSGGVALNCAANGRMFDLCEDLYVFPASNDAGVSYGAAAYVAAQNGDRVESIHTALYGPDYSSDDIKKMLDKYNIKYRIANDISNMVSDYIVDGKIVGWFHGNMEMGPRALGGRSILANPRGTPGRDKVNQCKGREYWRPFAPSLLYEDRSKYFEKGIMSRFMLKAVVCKKDTVERFPDIVHVDCTSRPHTVLPEDKEYYELLMQLKKKTGDGIILDTSFNGPGEPIVCSPIDAIRTFYSTGIDILSINEYVIEK